MKKMVAMGVMALFASSIFAQTPRISIKGIEIGLTKEEIKAVTGIDEDMLVMNVAGVKVAMRLRYRGGKLEMAMGTYSPVEFEIIKEAFSSKYQKIQCQNSSVQNNMGAKFDQVDCSYMDSEAVLEIRKYMDTNRGSLKIKSRETFEREVNELKSKKNDI